MRAGCRPGAALCQKRTLPRLLDHLVGGRLERWRNAQVESLGRFHINDELKATWLLGPADRVALRP